ncbi:MAG: hypothetical protein WC794_03670 [Candidatus Doudnabacteria bacterium]|jgi:hypothetical protein
MEKGKDTQLDDIYPLVAPKRDYAILPAFADPEVERLNNLKPGDMLSLYKDNDACNVVKLIEPNQVLVKYISGSMAGKEGVIEKNLGVIKSISPSLD